jgi:hypothetical protein
MRCRREGAVHWNWPDQQGGHCLPQGGSPEAQQSLQNGYFGGCLAKQVIITFRDATNQTDLIYGYTLSQRIFTFADSEHSVRYIRPIRPQRLSTTSQCTRSSSAKLRVKLQGHFRPEVRSLIARVAGAFRSRTAAPFSGSNSAQLLLHFQARKPLDVARHMASRLNAKRFVSRCKRCPGLHQFI